MTDLKQFLLLFILNLKRAYRAAACGVALFGMSALLYMMGYYDATYAYTLFLWCIVTRPSIELKNMQYLLLMLRYAVILLPFNWLVMHYGYYNWIAHGFLVPILISSNLYVLDSDLRIQRLLYAIVGIARLYTKLVKLVPVALVYALMSMYVSMPITLLGLLPCIVVMTSLLYYKSLFEEFRVYYAEF